MLRKKQRNMLLCCLAAILAGAIALLSCGFTATKAEEGKTYLTYAADNGIYDEYTDTDVHSGVELVDFPIIYSQGNGLNIAYSEGHSRIKPTQDNEITLFVPRELFRTEGIETYIGREYGFLKDTFAVEGSDALHTIVLLFNIIKEDNLAKTQDHLQITIEPVFQGEFAYVTPQTEYLMGLQFYNDDTLTYGGGHRGPFVVEASNDYVIAVPTVTEYSGDAILYEFRPVVKYYLKNFSSQVTLYNENHANAFEEDYNPQEDDGSFFTQTDFEYSGKFLKKTGGFEEKATDVLVKSLSLCWDIFSDTMGWKVGTYLSYAGSALDLFDSVMGLAEPELVEMTKAENKFTYTPFYTTKEEQLLHYGAVHKDALVEVLSAGDTDLVLGTGDHITTDYQIASEEPAWKTRYAAMLSVDAVAITDDGAGEPIRMQGCAYSDLLKNETTEGAETLAENTETEAILLPGGKKEFAVNPAQTGWYTFASDADEFDAAVLNGTENAAVYDEGTGTYRAYLHAGQNYIFEAGFANEHMGGRTDFYYTFDPQIVQTGSNSLSFNNSATEFMQLQFDESAFYRLTSNESGATFRVYDGEYNLIASGQQSVRAEYEAGERMFVSVTLPAAATKEVAIDCAKERDVVFVTGSDEVIATHTIVNDAYYELPVPAARPGYTYDGWYYNGEFEGQAVTSETLADIHAATITLHAKWTPIPYTITYIENGGEDIENGVYNVEYSIRLPDQMTREGYVFLGWYDNAELQGEAIDQIDLGSIGDRTFYAKWTEAEVDVAFDVNSAQTDGQVATLFMNGAAFSGSSVSVQYGETFCLPTAQTKGFTFAGWYVGNTQITNAEGESIAPCTFEGDTGVTAHWTRDSYTIKIVINETQTCWMIDGGFSDTEESIAYSSDLCPNCMVTALRNAGAQSYYDHIYRDGFIFNCFTTTTEDSTAVACWHSFAQDLTDGAEYTVYAYYNAETYYIHFEGVSGERNKYPFNEKIEYPEYETEPGFIVAYWRDTTTKEKLDAVLMPDLTPGEEGNGSISVEAVEEPDDYYIEYNLNGGSFSATDVVIRQFTVETDTFTLKTPLRTNYRFMGWYEDKNFTGSKVTQVEKGTCKDLEFYARWEREYTVTLQYNNRNVTGKYIQGEIVTVPSRNTADPNDANHYYKGIWQFKRGSSTFKTVTAGSSTYRWAFEGTSNVTIALTWEEITYKITYVHAFDATITCPQYHTYGKPTPLNENGVYGTMSNFRGFYDDANFRNRITEINKDKQGDIKVYLLWDYYLQMLYRSAEVKITDASEWKQHCDHLEIWIPAKTSDFSYYKSVKIKLEITVWEEDDGYQKFYLYNQNGEKLWFLELEHQPGKKSSEKHTYTFEFYVPLPSGWSSSDWTIYILDMRYNARGSGNDDWWNSQCRITSYLSTEAPQALNENNHYVWP